MSGPQSSKYQRIVLTAETAASNKFLRCTHPDGRQHFVIIQKVTPEYCWGLNPDTYDTRNYTYNQIPEGTTFETVWSSDIKLQITNQLEILNRSVTEATEKRDMYFRVMTSTFFHLLLNES